MQNPFHTGDAKNSAKEPSFFSIAKERCEGTASKVGPRARTKGSAHAKARRPFQNAGPLLTRGFLKKAGKNIPFSLTGHGHGDDARPA